MKRYWALAVALAVCGLAASTSGMQETSAQLLENGTMLYLELSKTLDAKKAKPGDQVRATLLTDVLSHGKIVLRQDSKFIGHITEVQTYSKEKPESRLGVVIDKIVGKGGQETEFQSVLMGISPAPRLHVETMTGPAPPNANPANPQQPDAHVPRPRPASTPVPPSYRDPFRRSEGDRVKSGEDLGFQPTDIEGLTLQSTADGGRVVVSFKNNVKLESGVQLVLRVTGQKSTNKASAQNP